MTIELDECRNLMKSYPLISIIIAVMNDVKTLQQCIDSIADQSYLNKELIIIDGGSNDGTIDLLKANNEQIKYWISEPDKGIYSAWNKGLTQAKGDWVFFLGADDYLWNTQVLEQMANQLEKLPSDIRVAYSKVMLLNNDGVSLYSIGEPWRKIKDRFKQVMCIPHPGAMHRHELFENQGNFDESFRIAGDYELILRELKTAEAFFISDIVIAGMRQGGISSHPKNTLISLREARRAQRMHGQYIPGMLWIMAIVRVYIRLLLWSILGEPLARKVLDLGRRTIGLPPFWTKT